VVKTKSRAGLGIVGLQGVALLGVLAARAPGRVRVGLLVALVAGAVLARGAVGAFVGRIGADDVARLRRASGRRLRTSRRSPRRSPRGCPWSGSARGGAAPRE